jgi:tetratricopeptide (TPR) repeat protein
LGLALFQRDETSFDEFVPVFEQAVKIETENPDINDPSIYNTIGYIYLNDRQYDKSGEYLTKGLDYFDDNNINVDECGYTNAALLYNMGRLNFERSDYEAAVGFLSKADKECNNPKARELLSVVDKLQKR